MSYADSINDEQKATIQSWADAGDDLSAIQKKLADELDVQVTYMEVRFLMDDLGISMPTKEEPVEKAPEEVEEAPDAEKAPSEGEVAGEEPAAETEKPEADAPVDEKPVATNVKVTMSEVLPMGAMAGGTVTFSDGVLANWAVDQMGQLSLDAPDPAYRPAEADVKAFQTELQKLAQEQRG